MQFQRRKEEKILENQRIKDIERDMAEREILKSSRMPKRHIKSSLSIGSNSLMQRGFSMKGTSMNVRELTRNQD